MTASNQALFLGPALSHNQDDMPLNLIKPYVSALLIQGLAAFSMMLVSILVARTWGVAGSTTWAQVKAISDFGSALLMMGFSQALAYYLGRNICYLKHLVRGLLIHSISALTISITISLLFWWQPAEVPGIEKGFSYVILGLGVASLVLSGLLRGVAVATAPRYLSSIVTSSYSYLMFLLIILCSSLHSSSSAIVYSNMFAALFSATIATIIVKKAYQSINLSKVNKEGIQYSKLLKFSVISFIITVFSAAIPLYTFHWLSLRPVPSLIGEFSVVIFLIAIITTPVNIISPYWYSRWAAFSEKQLNKEFLGWLGILILYSLLLLFIFSLATSDIIQFLFGKEFTNATSAAELTGTLSFVYVISRLISAREMSQNNMLLLGIASGLRLATVILLLLINRRNHEYSLDYAAFAWIIGEATFIVTIFLNKTYFICTSK